ncbi:MAG: hypothetical protein HZC36_04325 [Armatimonadetes bacterium]|nr:hypothetical protein [Armatimonadota bacterium]
MTEIGVGSTTYAYNDALRKVTITNPYSEVTQLTRDTSQRLSRKDFGNGTYETFGYDSRNRPNSILLKNSGGSTLSSQSYTYDNASNVTNHTQDGVSTTYGYDNIDQLTSETRTGYSASYTYDANGNRTSRTVNGLVETYSNDPGDKLTSVTWNGGYKNYGYDAAGRMTSVTTPSGTSWLTYDYEDRLTLVQIPSGGTNTFTYNGLDTRVGRVDRYLQPWTYKRDGAGVTAPLLSDGNSNFTPGASVRSSGTSTYQHAGIKSNTRQTASNQTVSSSKQYDAFGNLTSSSGSWVGPFSYGGPFGYQDDNDSGLKLLGHRYYDSSIGRFLTRDPTKEGRNWYSYCQNNPLVRVDPRGYWFETALDILGLFYDLAEFARSPSLMNGIYVLWSGASILVPAVPGSWVARAAKAGSKYVGKRGYELVNILRGGFNSRSGKVVASKAREVAHHIIPVSLAETVIERFARGFPGGEAALIEFLRNPCNGMWVDPARHSRLSVAYRQRLVDWFRDHPKADFKDFFDYAYDLARAMCGGGGS